MKPGSKFLLFISLLRILSCELTTFDRWKWKRRHRCKCHLPLPFKENLFFQSLAISFRCLKAGVCICRGMKLLLTRGCLFCIVIFPIVHEKSSPSKKKKPLPITGKKCLIHIISIIIKILFFFQL